jgi:glutamyl-Q tRNA(Asp) synthetase
VVRGADLLDSTARQIYLQQRLGLATPGYLHVPVAVNAAGQKLSKQAGAEALDLKRPAEALRRALVFLGQEPADEVAAGLRNWDPSRIPRSKVAH